MGKREEPGWPLYVLWDQRAEFRRGVKNLSKAARRWNGFFGCGVGEKASLKAGEGVRGDRGDSRVITFNQLRHKKGQEKNR